MPDLAWQITSIPKIAWGMHSCCTASAEIGEIASIVTRVDAGIVIVRREIKEGKRQRRGTAGERDMPPADSMSPPRDSRFDAIGHSRSRLGRMRVGPPA